jgi:hypothetical protein
VKRRVEIVALAVLLVVAGGIYLSSRSSGTGLPGITAADEKFQPLSVREPQLRLDEVAQLQKLDYKGTHRNIFVATPPPPEPTPADLAAAAAKSHVPYGPPLPPPDPPLVVPAQFFGYAFSKSGRRVAFFTSGDDVLVVPEGDTFMNRYRVAKIGTDSVDVDEVSSGKHARMPMLQPAADSAAGQSGFQPGQQAVPQ